MQEKTVIHHGKSTLEQENLKPSGTSKYSNTSDALSKQISNPKPSTNEPPVMSDLS